MYSAVKWKLISLLALAVPMVRPATRKTHMRVITGYPFCHSYTSVCAALCSMNRRLSSIMLHEQETIEHHAPRTGDYRASCSTNRRLSSIILHEQETIEHHAPRTGDYRASCFTNRRLLHTCSVMLPKQETKHTCNVMLYDQKTIAHLQRYAP